MKFAQYIDFFLNYFFLFTCEICPIGVQEASLDQMKTPLGEQLDKFGNQLTLIVGGVCLAVWLASIPKFGSAIFPSWYCLKFILNCVFYVIFRSDFHHSSSKAII